MLWALLLVASFHYTTRTLCFQQDQYHAGIPVYHRSNGETAGAALPDEAGVALYVLYDKGMSIGMAINCRSAMCFCRGLQLQGICHGEIFQSPGEVL